MEHFLETWGYLAIFGLSFISSVGIPVGADVAIIFGGALASGQLPGQSHHLNVVTVILITTLAEVLGSMIGYLIGFYGGRPLIDRLGKYLLLTRKDLDRGEEWLAKRGDPLVLFGRFIPLLRSFISLAAGVGEMSIRKFVAFTAVGCTIWCTALISVGYFLGASYHHVLRTFSYAGYVAVALAIVAAVFLFWHRWRALRSGRLK